MKKTVLIFGVSSFVGSNLAQFLSDEYRIIGTYHETPINIPGITCVPCDVLKKDYVTKLIAIFQPHYTIYGVGLSSLRACKLEPKRADALNSAGASNCLGASERYGSKFIFLSSCFVLGGEDLSYREGDTPFPTTVYGNSLSSSEFYIQRSCLNYLILRCSPLYGRSFNPKHPNWFEYLQASLAKNEILLVDNTVTTGFLDIFILSRILKSLMLSGITNRLLQVSSRDALTRFEFAKIYAKVFKKDENLIQPSAGSFPLDTKSRMGNSKANPKNLFFKMDLTNVESSLGVPMPSIEESLELSYKRLQG
jgi:dTDP-4-dehydrorhamnose reductase